MDIQEVPPVITEIVKRIDEKVDSLDSKVDHLIEMDRLRNGRWDAHIVEDAAVHTKVEIHDEAINSVRSMRNIFLASIVSVIIALFGATGYWNYAFGHLVGNLEARGIALSSSGVAYAQTK